MRRREFITVLGGAAAWPLAARAQQPAVPVIGFLGAGSQVGVGDWMDAFRQGLRERGFLEGSNIAIESRWADGHIGLLPELAADLVRDRVAVIVSPLANAAAVVAKAASATIPVVFGIAGDPVALGLVASLNRPGGNVTGVWTLAGDTLAKRLQMLHEAAPTGSIIGVLLNPTGPSHGAIPHELQSAARTLGLQLQSVYASSESEFDNAFQGGTRRGKPLAGRLRRRVHGSQRAPAERQMRPGDRRRDEPRLRTKEAGRGEARPTAGPAEGMAVRKVRRGVARAEDRAR